MAATARRIGLSTRSGRKTSREEDGVILRSRKISSGNKLSREENPSATRGARQPSRAIQEGESICTERYQNDEMNISRPEEHVSFNANNVTRATGDKPRRKISVYARPETLERKVNQQRSQTRWQEFLMRYEPFIFSALALLILCVSIYIVFIERQSLFSKQGI